MLTLHVMGHHTYDMPSLLERLLSDRRVVIGGLSAGGIVILGSLILGSVGGPPNSKATKAVSVLPDAPLNIPLIRQLPHPEPRKGEFFLPHGSVAARR